MPSSFCHEGKARINDSTIIAVEKLNHLCPVLSVVFLFLGYYFKSKENRISIGYEEIF